MILYKKSNTIQKLKRGNCRTIQGQGCIKFIINDKPPWAGVKFHRIQNVKILKMKNREWCIKAMFNHPIAGSAGKEITNIVYKCSEGFKY